NEKVALGGLLEWLRSIGDRTRNQTALTIVDKHPSGTTSEPERRTDVLPQVGSGCTVRLDLHADSIALRRGGTRERVAAKQGGATWCPRKAQDHVLPRQSSRQRPAVQTLHCQREDVRALLVDRRHREPPKPWCDRMRGCCRHEPGVAASLGSCLALQQCLERRAPPGRQRRDTQSALQSI